MAVPGADQLEADDHEAEEDNDKGSDRCTHDVAGHRVVDRCSWSSSNCGSCRPTWTGVSPGAESLKARAARTAEIAATEWEFYDALVVLRQQILDLETRRLAVATSLFLISGFKFLAARSQMGIGSTPYGERA